MKLEILYKTQNEFKKRNDIAIHSLKPSYNELLSLIDDAIKDGFKMIVVYDDQKWSKFNIKNGQSTWSRLIRDIDGDVRCGEVGFKHGSSLGDGFTIYLNGVK